ncbi:hypothetical protein TNCV_1113981 [Trichonephila clavipes]|nr:hypothetical protein TNCV_1113981 [Trichonephila clavipes]
MHYRRKTDFFPEDTTMSYSGFDPNPRVIATILAGRPWSPNTVDVLTITKSSQYAWIRNIQKQADKMLGLSTIQGDSLPDRLTSRLFRGYRGDSESHRNAGRKYRSREKESREKEQKQQHINGTENILLKGVSKIMLLQPKDYPLHRTFAVWFLQQTAADRAFAASVSLTDKEYFTREGAFNQLKAHVCGLWCTLIICNHEQLNSVSETIFKPAFLETTFFGHTFWLVIWMEGHI